MKKFDKVKTLQLALLTLLAIAALASVLRDANLYALIGSSTSVRLISIILWLTLGLSFLFLLYDFNSYADMKRENLELDNAVYSDALTGLANRYSVDAYMGRFLGQPLPEDMGVITLEITNLSDINRIHGHSAGDIAIQRFSGLLLESADGACFIGRNGGNKFVAIFRDCTTGRLERFIASVEAKTGELRRASDGYEIAYRCGLAFNEGESIGSVTELVALSDRRAREADI